MRTKIAASVALLTLMCMMFTSAEARYVYKRYTREYVGASTPGLSFRFSPGDTNPGQINPAEELPPLEGGPADQKPLEGTDADQYPLRGTPADVNIAGVSFAKGSFKGTPYKIIVKDASASPVQWSACQLNGDVPVCGSNAEDVQQIGCGTQPGGTRLGGFSPRGAISVWIIATDPAGVDGVECSGPAIMGTVTLITRVRVR